MDESFLLVFFKKEDLAYFPVALRVIDPPAWNNPAPHHVFRP
jgi:hypothetical protein